MNNQFNENSNNNSFNGGMNQTNQNLGNNYNQENQNSNYGGTYQPNQNSDNLGQYNMSNQTQNNNFNSPIQAGNNTTQFNTQNTQASKSSNKMLGIIIAVVTLVVLIPIVILVISRGAITSIFNDTKAPTFVRDAKLFVSAAHSLITDEQTSFVLGYAPTNYSPICYGEIDESSIPLSALKSYTNISESPYGGNYDFNSSFIKAVAQFTSDGSCEILYYIYLTDGTHSIGTSNNPILEDELSTKQVKK